MRKCELLSLEFLMKGDGRDCMDSPHMHPFIVSKNVQ